jgi:hypothetical protein
MWLSAGLSDVNTVSAEEACAKDEPDGPDATTPQSRDA